MRVAVIPARGGSRRIPRKNIREFHGRPIIAYSIENAKLAKFDRVVVSTDDDEIAEVARREGAEVLMRPAQLAEDAIGTHEVTKHACEVLKIYDWQTVCCLYATTPLLPPFMLKAAVDCFFYRRPTFLVAVGTEPLRDAGAFYIGHAHGFRNFDLYKSFGRALGGTDIFVLPEDMVCDINTPEDFRRAEEMYAALNASAGAR